MMIGPAPMMRMLWMSVRLGIGRHSARPRARGVAKPAAISAASTAAHPLSHVLFSQLQLRLQATQHEVVEALEQRAQVVWAGARLGMPLEAEHRPLAECESLQRAVEQRAVRRLHLGR